MSPTKSRAPQATAVPFAGDRRRSNTQNGTAPGVPQGVLALRAGALWKAFIRQPISFYFVFGYVFFEYVRPQSIYESLDVFPFARVSLLAGVAFTALSNRSRRFILLDVGILLYALCVLLSLLTAFSFQAGWDKIGLFGDWMMVYWIVSSSAETPTRFFLMLCGWLLWNFKMSMFGARSWAEIGFTFRDWGVQGAPGWFTNSGEFGIEMCMVLPISLYFALGLREHLSRWKFFMLLALPITASMSIVASSSRGALVGLAAIALWAAARSRYKLKGLVGLAALGLALWIFTPAEQVQRLSESGSDVTSVYRLTYWKNGIRIANEYPLFGIGYENWLAYYAVHFPLPHQLPHNIFIQAVAELGYTGLLAFLFLIIGTFVVNARTRRYARAVPISGSLFTQLAWGLDGALIGFLVSGFFVTVLYYPFFWINLAFTAALHLSTRRAAGPLRPIEVAPPRGLPA